MAACYGSLADFADFAGRVRSITEDEAYRYVSPLRPRLKDRQNPMEVYNDAEFSWRYRFSKQAVLRLLEMLPLVPKDNERGHPVPPLLQLLIALRFYGAGTFQVVTGDLVNVSQATVSRIIARMSRMIAETLFPQLVKLPNANDLASVMEEFYTIARFPGVSGCIDCTHVPIRSPGGDEAEVFRCRKGYFSINVQAITGPRLQFFDVVASWPGSAHDSRIFDNSRARVQYEEGNVPGILLGDKGYPCRSYLMTPFRETQSSPQHRYNKCHSRTRCSVERAFGVWKRRFPCLEMTLQIKTRSVPIVITACAALHNFGHLLRDPVPPPAQCQATHNAASQAPTPSFQPTPPGMSPLPDTASGFRIRDRIVAQYFT
ncbi:putative nuclease HARBI1 [Dermacentor andersoni]|uniref:putative nuclease HARBI1 n=1 Tax=Dermacentor andersoni TaxID=34620 RepID=UPI002155AA93|nr:putative nuclease HARBI1 [Dermacentor andersoni]XP_050043083.1 putative nuclease HARBI1 [Dermacentor andersoni]